MRRTEQETFRRRGRQSAERENEKLKQSEESKGERNRATEKRVGDLVRGSGGFSPRWLRSVTRQSLCRLLIWQLHLDNYSFCSWKHWNLHNPAALRPAGRPRLVNTHSWHDIKAHTDYMNIPTTTRTHDHMHKQVEEGWKVGTFTQAA